MRWLFILVIAVVIISVALFSSLNSPSGFATNNQSGLVDIEIIQVLEINLLNGTVNFGSCAINLTQGYLFLDSALGLTGANNSECTSGVFPSELVIKNTGTLNANVTVSVAQTGSDFFNDTDSWLAYRSFNGTNGGCLSGLQVDYTNFSIINNSYTVCSNLTKGSLNSEVSIPIQAYVNASATGSGTFLMYFSASLPS